jgi:hypothetical protein
VASGRLDWPIVCVPRHRECRRSLSLAPLAYGI